MIDRHKAAAESMARAAALRRVVVSLGPTVDRITRRRVQSAGNEHVTIMRVAHRVTRKEALVLAVEAEHAAIADLAEYLETLIDSLVADAARDLATVAVEARRWKSDVRTKPQGEH